MSFMTFILIAILFICSVKGGKDQIRLWNHAAIRTWYWVYHSRSNCNGQQRFPRQISQREDVFESGKFEYYFLTLWTIQISYIGYGAFSLRNGKLWESLSSRESRVFRIIIRRSTCWKRDITKIRILNNRIFFHTFINEQIPLNEIVFVVSFYLNEWSYNNRFIGSVYFDTSL